MYYVLGMDLAHVAVGPFDKVSEAQAYIDRQKSKGASSKFSIHTADDLLRVIINDGVVVQLIISQERDAEIEAKIDAMRL